MAAAREQLEDVRRVNAGGQGWGCWGLGGRNTVVCPTCRIPSAQAYCTECAPRLQALRSPLLKTRTLRGCLLLPGTEQQPSQPLPLLGPRFCCPSPPLPGSTTLLLLQSWSSTPSLWSCKRSSWRSSSCCPSTAAGRQSRRGGSWTMGTMKTALFLEDTWLPPGLLQLAHFDAMVPGGAAAEPCCHSWRCWPWRLPFWVRLAGTSLTGLAMAVEIWDRAEVSISGCCSARCVPVGSRGPSPAGWQC